MADNRLKTIAGAIQLQELLQAVQYPQHSPLLVQQRYEHFRDRALAEGTSIDRLKHVRTAMWEGIPSYMACGQEHDAIGSLAMVLAYNRLIYELEKIGDENKPT